MDSCSPYCVRTANSPHRAGGGLERCISPVAIQWQLKIRYRDANAPVGRNEQLRGWLWISRLIGHSSRS
jgi:hypothetical protein